MSDYSLKIPTEIPVISSDNTIEAYGKLGIDSSSDISAKDFIEGASDPDIEALAEGILDQLGIENPTKEIIDDVATLVKIHAKKLGNEVSISNFITDVIKSLQDATNDDDILTEDELETGIVQEAKEVLPTEIANKKEDAVYGFLADILSSINDGKDLKPEDADVLNELLGLDDPDLAKEIIEQTDGKIDDILDIFANASEDGKIDETDFTDFS